MKYLIIYRFSFSLLRIELFCINETLSKFEIDISAYYLRIVMSPLHYKITRFKLNDVKVHVNGINCNLSFKNDQTRAGREPMASCFLLSSMHNVMK